MSNENPSGLAPVGRAVLVRPYQPEIKKGLIVMPDSVGINQAIVEQRAIIVAIGPAAWAEELAAGHPARAKVGDKVLISGYAGYMAKGTADGEQYRFVNDKDIFAQIEVES